MLTRLIREVMLPPGVLLLAGFLVLALWNKRPKMARYGLAGLLVLLYLLSIPLVSMALTGVTHEIPARSLDEIREFRPEAILVLGSGVYRDAPEYAGEARVSSGTFVRLEYAAYLARSLGEVPVLATGGYGESLEESEGFVAARTLKEWGVKDVWMETAAENTRENAVFSKEIADVHNVKRIALVTSASHAPRAEEAFRDVGFEVLACPTGFRTPSGWEHGVFLFVPTHHHFHESSYALRTLLARLWYRIRY